MPGSHSGRDLIRASGSDADRRGEPEQDRRPSRPPADQSAALEALTEIGARSWLRPSRNLLVELRKELQARLVAELTEMHRNPGRDPRDHRRRRAPRVLRNRGRRLIAVAGLCRRGRDRGTDRTPARPGRGDRVRYRPPHSAPRASPRNARRIEGWLKEGDVAARTIALEIRVEEDLLGLLQAIRRLPRRPRRLGLTAPSDLREREREAEPARRRAPR